MFIRATGNISPQLSFGHPPFLSQPVIYDAERLACIEPDYKDFIDIKLIRRMSRIIRMGVAAAMECLKEAGIEKPDAIVTGTAYGCLEDTGVFLGRMVEFNEELLTPTAFIQSTHNTIGAQIGLMLQCNNYNNAFVHRGFSFESALLDAIMLLKENDAQNVLVGAIDEITNYSFSILKRLGLFRNGTSAGEGAAFFLLSNIPSENDYAKLEGLRTIYKPASQHEVDVEIETFLKNHEISAKDIDVIITGDNISAERVLFKNSFIIPYKHLCGDYPTASAFAFWMAANFLKEGKLPQMFKEERGTPQKLQHVLIHNQYQGIHHALFLLSAC